MSSISETASRSWVRRLAASDARARSGTNTPSPAQISDAHTGSCQPITVPPRVTTAANAGGSRNPSSAIAACSAT